MFCTGADEEGQTLKEVFTFEVEKIRSTVANYKNQKSHKDLAKRERQLERDAHMSKVCVLSKCSLTI